MSDDEDTRVQWDLWKEKSTMSLIMIWGLRELKIIELFLLPQPNCRHHALSKYIDSEKLETRGTCLVSGFRLPQEHSIQASNTYQVLNKFTEGPLQPTKYNTSLGHISPWTTLIFIVLLITSFISERSFFFFCAMKKKKKKAFTVPFHCFNTRNDYKANTSLPSSFFETSLYWAQ